MPVGCPPPKSPPHGADALDEKPLGQLLSIPGHHHPQLGSDRLAAGSITCMWSSHELVHFRHPDHLACFPCLHGVALMPGAAMRPEKTGDIHPHHPMVSLNGGPTMAEVFTYGVRTPGARPPQRTQLYLPVRWTCSPGMTCSASSRCSSAPRWKVATFIDE